MISSARSGLVGAIGITGNADWAASGVPEIPFAGERAG